MKEDAAKQDIAASCHQDGCEDNQRELQYVGGAFGDVLGGYRAGNEAYCFHFGTLAVPGANNPSCTY